MTNPKTDDLPAPLIMKREVKQAWLRELRSGKYVQGAHALHKESTITGGHEFCCLGVLCSVLNIPSKPVALPNAEHLEYEYEGQCEFLPPAAFNAAGAEFQLYVYVTAPYAEIGWLIEKYPYLRLRVDEARVVIHISGCDSKVNLYLTRLNDAGVSFADIATIIEKYVAEVE